MDLDTGTVQTYRFKSHAEKTLVLQAFKNPVQNTGLVPSAHAHIDSMPLSEPFREPPPFAPIFHDIQNGIEHLKVVVGDIASMDGETICYTLVLLLADLHHATILTYFDPFDNILSKHSLASGWPFTETNLCIPHMRAPAGTEPAGALVFIAETGFLRRNEVKFVSPTG